MKPKTPYPVLVEWLDAAINPMEDRPTAEIRETDLEAQVCETVGILLETGKTNLVLAFEMSPGENGTPSYRTIQRIPRRIVRKVTRLRKSGNVRF